MSDQPRTVDELAKKQKPSTWPPKVGQRISYHTGWDHTSWSGVVMFVDEEWEVVLLRCWSAAKKTWRFRVENKLLWQFAADKLFEGGLHRSIKKIRYSSKHEKA